MYCKKCGSQISDGAVFCKKCGAKQTVILSADETGEKINSETINEQELPNNTYTDETATFIENEPSKDNHKAKIKKKWLLLIAIGVPLILIGIFLILWNMGIFKSGLSESEVRTAISNHMRDAHGVRIEEFTNISIDKSGAQATVIIVYNEDGYDVTYPPSTVTLNAQGDVISCIFCQSDSEEDETSSSEDFDDTIVGTFETDNQTTAHYSHVVFYDDGKFEAYTGMYWTDYPYWPNTNISEQVPSFDSGTYTESGDIITANLHKIGGLNCTLKFQKVKNNSGEPLLIIIDAAHDSYHCLDGEYGTEEVGVGYVKVSNRYLEMSSHSDIDTIPAEGTILKYSNDPTSSQENPNYSNDSSSASVCPRCGRPLTDGETCECTWCDICNAWMLGHGHGEGEEPVDSSTSQSNNNSSTQNGTGSTEDFVPIAPEVLSVTPHINADNNASILLDITISDLSLGEKSPSHYNAGENLTITVNGTKVNHETAWWGGKKWQIQIDNINLSDTKTFTIVLTNKYGLSTTRTVTFP